MSNTPKIALVQPFGLESPTGGSRILRSMVKDAPLPFVSVASCIDRPPPTALGQEIFLPFRPTAGRLERSRFGRIFDKSDRFFLNRFEDRLKTLLREQNVTAVHSVPHRVDFISIWRAAQALALPHAISIHDHIDAALSHHPYKREVDAVMKEVWNGSACRFVISDQMGEEYCRLYGDQPFVMVTDGPVTLHEPQPIPQNRLGIYFMGMFHLRYVRNLATMREALHTLNSTNPGLDISFTLRCGELAPDLMRGPFPISVLPFAGQREIDEDMKSATLLYFPLPFGAEDATFVRTSFSTKVVNYLSTGIPILYHGPPEAAPALLLKEYNAAIMLHTLDPEEVTAKLREFATNPSMAATHVEGALALARDKFMLADQRRIFWDGLAAASNSARAWKRLPF